MFHLTWEVVYGTEQHNALIDVVLLWLGLPKLAHFPLEKKNPNNNQTNKKNKHQKNQNKSTLEKFVFSERRHFMLEP